MKNILPRYYRATVLALLVAFVVVPMAVAAESASETQGEEQSTGDWIVKLDEGWNTFQGMGGAARFLGDSTQRTLGSDASTLVISFDGETRASDAIARLTSHPAVTFVEPDIIYEYQTEEFIPNDANFDQQQWAQTVNLPQAWTISAGNPDVMVSVVDSGIRADHPDLEGQVIPGRNYVDGFAPDDTTDLIGHGTGVAGIIAAVGNNEIGIAGTSMNVQLLPMRVGADNGAPVSKIAEAVEDSVNLGAKIINLSLGSETQSARLEQALAYADANDVIVIAATGNDTHKVSFPGSSPSTISVGATTLDGSSMAPFSSQVSVTDLVAPGMGVYTTYYDGAAGENTYATVSGTSFSTPIVSGAAALIHSVNPDLDVHQVRSLLRETAQMTFTEGTAGTGAGLLDVNAAVRQASLASFGASWLPADEPVASLATSRTWLWGPNAFDLRVEQYSEAEHGFRLVAYYDKSRMELTNPYGDRTSPWFVTNGLLVNELVSGQMQVGDNDFEARDPADIPVAGDPEGNNGPTYASFSGLVGEETQHSAGDVIAQTLDREGQTAEGPEYAEHEIVADEFIPETGHFIANVFWDYLNSSGTLWQQGHHVEGRIFDPTFFATGFPVTDAYWSQVTVGGVEQDVLIQCFERRCLTYTPDNDPGWQVEMGNVGQHYYRWRYGEDPEGVAVEDPSAYALENLR